MFFHLRACMQSACKMSVVMGGSLLSWKYFNGKKHLDKPLQLISVSDKGKLILNEETKAALSDISGNVRVVTCVGKYRVGKSTLMNKLYGAEDMFRVSHTHEPQTKGLWVITKPHPEKEDDTLVLVDTEGLYDINNESELKDRKLFALVVACSSSVINMIEGIPDARDMNELNSVLLIANDWMQHNRSIIMSPVLHMLVAKYELERSSKQNKYFHQRLMSHTMIDKLFHEVHIVCLQHKTSENHEEEYNEFQKSVIVCAPEYKIGEATCTMKEWLIHVEQLVRGQDIVPDLPSTEKLVKKSINKRESANALKQFHHSQDNLKFPNPYFAITLQDDLKKYITECKNRAFDGCIDAERKMKKEIKEMVEKDKNVTREAESTKKAIAMVGTGGALIAGACLVPIAAPVAAVVGLGGAAVSYLAGKDEEDYILKTASRIPSSRSESVESDNE